MAEFTVKVEFSVDKLNSLIEKLKEENSDLVEVVRCKDCALYSASSHGCNLYLRYTISKAETDFCSYGLRKSGEENG